MRLTITRKIALAMVVNVVTCVGTMAWFTSKNLQRGFVDYLNENQVQELGELSAVLADRFRVRGEPAGPQDNSQVPTGYSVPAQQPLGHSSLVAAAGSDYFAPAGDQAPTGLRSSASNRTEALSIVASEASPGTRRDIMAGELMSGASPLKQIANAGANGFVYGQIRDMVWLALGLIGFSALLALWLARQLLRPVSILRNVAQLITAGRLDARATICGRDELAELAQHVNAMAQTLDVNEQQRCRMLADVAHELRTPLTVIRGEIEALLDGIREIDPMALKSLHVEVLHLNKLINDLHQLASDDAGDLQYQCCELDLGELVRDVTQRHRSRIVAAGLTLECKTPPHAVTVLGDAGRLTQLLSNLLENSIRYTDIGGCVVVAVAATGSNAELSIDDSSPGVPPETHGRLFERLYRVDQARNRVCGGNGLGLSICKSLVAAHGGSIAAMTSFLGGVRIVVRLPLSSTSETRP